MALYDRKCNSCDHTWEVSCKISEKDQPQTCPECQSTDGEWLMSAPLVSMKSGRFMGGNKDGGMREVFQKLAKHHPNTPLAQRV